MNVRVWQKSVLFYIFVIFQPNFVNKIEEQNKFLFESHVLRTYILIMIIEYFITQNVM